MSVERMLRIDLVAFCKDLDDVMEALQEAGVLHITEVEESAASRGTHLGPHDALDRYQRLDRAVHGLRSVAPAPARRQILEVTPDEALQRVEGLLEQRAALQAELATVTNQLATMRPWGDFDPQDVEAIRGAGLEVVFAELSTDEWERLAPRIEAYSVACERGGVVYVVLFDVDPADHGISPVALPRIRLRDLERRRDELTRQIGAGNRELGRYAHFAPMLEAMMAALEDQVELIRARDLGLAEGPLIGLRGYVPAGLLFDLQRALADYAVALTASEPDPAEEVPVLLRNNWFTRGFEAILKQFSGISYREKDVTWVVGILFIVFGSLCLLDAGYGLLLMATGVWLRSRGNRDFFRVFTITGFFATIVGILSGQVFGLVVGQHIYKEATPPLPLVTDPLACFIFSLVVGGIAMAFSYGVAIWQRGARTDALGSLVLVVSLGIFVLGEAAPSHVAHLFTGRADPSAAAVALAASSLQISGALGIAAAVVAWIFYPDPVFGEDARAGNIFWTVYAGFTGLLQDILSHMRLFGIALSGSILALVVNDIGGRLPLPAFALFAVLGHCFVFALALLSLYIHTNRLIFLEFGSKCIEGGHFYYSPLRRGASV